MDASFEQRLSSLEAIVKRQEAVIRVLADAVGSRQTLTSLLAEPLEGTAAMDVDDVVQRIRGLRHAELRQIFAAQFGGHDIFSREFSVAVTNACRTSREVYTQLLKTLCFAESKEEELARLAPGSGPGSGPGQGRD